MFYPADPWRCRIVHHDIFHKANNTMPQAGQELFYQLKYSFREDDGFKFDTLMKLTDGWIKNITFPFRYRALAKGGAFIFKDVNIHIKICGYEVLRQFLPVPAVKQIELWQDQPFDETAMINPRELFNTNDSFCPTVWYKIVMKLDDNTADADQTARDLKQFYLINRTMMNITAQAPGVYNYWVEGYSVTGKRIVKNINQTNYPCRPSVATIVPPSDPISQLMKGTYFQSWDRFVTTYNITIDNINQFDLLNQVTNVTIPKFRNNDDLLCPLDYTLVMNDKPYTALNKPYLVQNSTINVDIPLLSSTKLLNRTWTFIMKGQNRDDSFADTNMITVFKEPFCYTKVGPVAVNKTFPNFPTNALREFRFTNWLDKFDVFNNVTNTTTRIIPPFIRFNVSTVFPQWGGFSIGPNDCPLMDPFFYINWINKTDNATTTVYNATENLQLIVDKLFPLKSYFRVLTKSSGHSDLMTFTMIDVRGFKAN